jgi:hypothetical protein
MTSDRRRHVRAFVHAPGAIVIGKALAVDCIIRDLSSSGACIQIANTAGIPDNFELQFKRADGEALDCRVASRSPNRLGICFTQVAAAMSSAALRAGASRNKSAGYSDQAPVNPIAHDESQNFQSIPNINQGSLAHAGAVATAECSASPSKTVRSRDGRIVFPIRHGAWLLAV